MVIDQKKSNAIAIEIEIVTKKSNAIVIMHYFYEKSNSIIKVLIIAITFFFALCNFLKNGKIYPKSDFWVPGKISVEKLIEDTQQESAITYIHINPHFFRV